MQEILISFAGWTAARESQRKSRRVKEGLERRKAAGLPVGRQPGAVDKKPRRRSGYVAAYQPGGKRFRAVDERQAADTP